MNLGSLYWQASSPLRRASAGLRPLPDAIIVGAQKAGTTFLFDLLSGHPGVLTSLIKEVHHFDGPNFADLAAYRSTFPLAARRGRIVVEASPYYLFHPAVPARIAAALPAVRIIVILRDPVARAYSHYQHQRRKPGVEPLVFAEALKAEDERLAGAEELLIRDPSAVSWAHRFQSYRARGCYARQLARYFSHLPRQRMLVLQSADLFRHPDDTLARVCAFLGLASLRAIKSSPSNSGGVYDRLDPATADGLRDWYRPHDEALATMLGAWPPWRSAESATSPA